LYCAVATALFELNIDRMRQSTSKRCSYARADTEEAGARQVRGGPALGLRCCCARRTGGREAHLLDDPAPRFDEGGEKLRLPDEERDAGLAWVVSNQCV